MAGIAPAAMLQQIAKTLHAARCALAEAVLQDNGGFAVNGVADAATAESLRHDVDDLPGTPPVAWHVQKVDSVFCPALSLLRPISPLGGAPGQGVGLTLRGNITRLHEDEPIQPRITMPDFSGELRVDYFVHDNTLAHLYPTLADPQEKWAAQPSRKLAAGERLALGDRVPGKPYWPSGPPFGTDMIIAVASSVPLQLAPKSNAEDKADGYLADLARAIEQARAAGAQVSGALLLVHAIPKAH
jgi:serine/threonine-protein kinase